MEYRKLQEALASQARANYKKESPLSDRVIDAFLEVPRHQFVNQFRNFGDDTWHKFDSNTGAQYLPMIYQDKPIVIWGSNAEFESKKGQKQVSTISQPSFVLRMLDLLDIRAGQNVFELGTASGWNAALISRLVGPSGKVVTVEIIEELAAQAASRLDHLEYRNIKVISGDGTEGDPSAVFDRAMFTAGAFDFPKALFTQIKIDGLVLFVLKNKGGTDNLYLLKRQADFFESIYALPCGFVPVTGKSHVSEMDEKDLEEFLKRSSIDSTATGSVKFWWGVSNKDYFIWQTSPLRGFLSLFSEFEAFHLESGEGLFGWFDKASNSLAVARPGELISYGGTHAQTQLIEKLKAWIDLGMPSLCNMNLRIYPSNKNINAAPGSWISRRPQATFVWSLAST